MKKTKIWLLICIIFVLGGIVFGIVNSTSTPVHTDSDSLEAKDRIEQSALKQDNKTPPKEVPPAQSYGPKERALALGLAPPPDMLEDSWALILVNSSHQLDKSFVPTTATASSKTSTCVQDARIVDALNAFAAAGEEAGVSVYLSSGYRSYEQQAANLQRKLNEGMSYEQAITMVQPAGSSEHQTGLCCDITDVYHPLKSPALLEQTSTYKWLYEHCHEYGFILRYPNGKSDVTGIIYEPWHFRYVGKSAARYIMDNQLCLEEFLALYDIY